jgi:putative spermidine/putrescine transport system ATP-binding protein
MEFRGIAKSYGGVTALRPLDLEIAPTEFLTLLGPSGSGKTTLLNIGAGYIVPDAGEVLIDGRDITHTPARKRNMGMVFQSYALFPHLSVFENVAYGLRARKVQESEIARRVEAALATVQLDGLGKRAISELSGGQGQRVALARALVIEPDVLLMDEPLGALDRQLRKDVQLELRRIHKSLGNTTLYVTHDQEEALVMSDRIGIMRDGRLEQIGTPRDLYERPANDFVARFLGESNLLPGRIVRRDSSTAEVEVPALGANVRSVVDASLVPGDAVAVLLRPECLRLEAGNAGVPVKIVEVVYLGELVAIRLALRDGQGLWCRRMVMEGLPAEDSQSRLAWRPEDVRILPLARPSTSPTQNRE